MIYIKEIEELHKILIDHFGGAPGVRDYVALDSAINRPFQTFDGVDLYPSVLQKAASLIESLIINHPFVDGNKRTVYTVIRLFLLANRFDIILSQEDKYRFVINIASGNYDFNLILKWLYKNAIKESDERHLE